MKQVWVLNYLEYANHFYAERLFTKKNFMLKDREKTTFKN